MQPIELYIIVSDIILIAFFMTFPKVKLHSKQISDFLIENPGSPFIFAFVVLLLAAAVYFDYGSGYVANELSEIAYFMILAGVVLQAASPYVNRALRGLFKRLLNLKKKKQDQ